MILDPVETLERLVAVPSVNPMGRKAADPTFGEARLTDHLEETFARIGLTTYRQPVATGRENLIAKLDGAVPASDGGPLLLLDAHQDTVPVEGMTIDPFRPVQRDGRLYGRGACDTKGGMAAIISAVSRLATERPPGMPTIVVSCTVNEEYGFDGARRLTELWSGGPSPIMPRTPDAAVAAEPTALDVVVAHKGVIRWWCRARGRAAHSSQPTAGDSAIYRMGHVLMAIEQYAAQLNSSVGHPLCGSGTVSVGTICGGVSVNTVPDNCTIEIECRLPPGEDPDTARQRLIDTLSAKVSPAFPLEHSVPYMSGPPLCDADNGPLADRLARVAMEVAGCGRKLGVPYATNAALFSATGVPAVVFGPGCLEAGAHRRRMALARPTSPSNRRFLPVRPRFPLNRANRNAILSREHARAM